MREAEVFQGIHFSKALSIVFIETKLRLEIGHLFSASSRIQSCYRCIRSNAMGILIHHFKLLGPRLLHLLERSSQRWLPSRPNKVLGRRILTWTGIFVVDGRNISNSLDAAYVKELAIFKHRIRPEGNISLIMTLLSLIILRIIGAGTRFVPLATILLTSKLVVDEPRIRLSRLVLFHIRVLNKI